MKITVLAIKRPIFICMFVLALIFLGILSHSKMKKELIPTMNFPQITVRVDYPGAGPEEIESQIVEFLEQNLSGTPCLKKITSVAYEEEGEVTCDFFMGTDSKEAAANVRDKVAVAKKSFPKEAKEPVIMKVSSSANVIMSVALKGNISEKELRYYADRIIKPDFASVPGVDRVIVNGGDKREIQVNVDAKRLNAYDLDIDEVLEAVHDGSLNSPAGIVRQNQKSFFVRTIGEYTSAEDIKRVRISNGEGKSFSLSDLADIKDGIAERNKLIRVNGNSCVILSITKSTEGNIVEISNEIKEKIKKYNETFPKGIELVLIFNDAETTENAIFEVNKTLKEAIVIVVLIVLLFLHSARGTFIVSVAIPTSLFATYGPINLLGFSLNSMSLLALALVIGILVDDSIVVLENIERHLKKGEEVIDASVNGRSEIGFAAIAISLVDIVVFLPIAYMGGVVGQLFRQFGITIAIAVVFSLFMSFTLTPMLSSKWLKKTEETKKDLESLEHRVLSKKCSFVDYINYYFNCVMNIFTLFLEKITLIYRYIVEWTLLNKFTTLMIGFGMLFTVLCFSCDFFCVERIVLMVLTVLCSLIALFTQKDKFVPIIYLIVTVCVLLFVKFPLEFEFFPNMDQGCFSVIIRMPEGTSLNETDRVVKRFEKVIKDLPYMQKCEKEYKEVLIYNPLTWFKKEKKILSPRYITVVGGTTESDEGDNGDNYAVIDCYMWEKRFRPNNDVKDVINDLYPKFAKIEGPKSVGIEAAGLEVGDDGPDGVTYKVQGNVHMKTLNSVAQNIADIMSKTDGLGDVNLSFKSGLPEKQLLVKRYKIADMGLSVEDIGFAMRDSINGNTDTKFRDNGMEYDINVRYRKEDRDQISKVSETLISNISNHPVYANNVAQMKDGFAPNKIERENRQRKITISSTILGGYSLGNLQNKCDEEVHKLVLPQGVSISYAGQSESMDENFDYIFVSLFTALILTYFLMCALFESMLTPFVIFLTIPQAMVGALLALYITGTELNAISLIGMIMLVGLVTKNAILMCDYSNTLRQRGLTKHEALINAGSARLRPILMTTVAMIGGMLPMAIDKSIGSELRAGMAVAVIGGLCFSMFLTLFIIPVMYDIVDAFWKKCLTLPIMKGIKKSDDMKENEWSANRSENFNPDDVE